MQIYAVKLTVFAIIVCLEQIVSIASYRLFQYQLILKLTDHMAQKGSPHSPFILALDVGTLSTRAFVYDQFGRVHGSASKPVQLHQLSEVQIEQDPLEIIDSLFEVMTAVLREPHIQEAGLGAAGLSTQRSSIVAWDKETGQPLTPVLSWQDRRAAEYLRPLAKHASKIKNQSGLFLSPHYGASKLRWCIDHYPELQPSSNGNPSTSPYVFGPLASFILYHLLQKNPHTVDHVNASRTQLFDLEQRTWSPDLLEIFNLTGDRLPNCQPTQFDYGLIKDTTIPLMAVNGDQNAAIHGLGPLDTETFIINIGTGAFILLPTGNHPIHHPRLLASIANSKNDSATYVLEGTVNGAGAAIKWAADQWGEPDLSRQLEGWLQKVENPPIFVNTIGGLGSPLWEEGPPPAFYPADGTLAEKAVAVVESIIFLIQINLETMTHTGQDVKRIRISGGLAEIDGVCQLLADISQRLVIRSEERQSTSRGIAWLAGKPNHDWNNLEEDFFLPTPNKPLQLRYRSFSNRLGWS